MVSEARQHGRFVFVSCEFDGDLDLRARERRRTRPKVFRLQLAVTVRHLGIEDQSQGT